jgi:hypothetical protein
MGLALYLRIEFNNTPAAQAYAKRERSSEGPTWARWLHFDPWKGRYYVTFRDEDLLDDEPGIDPELLKYRAEVTYHRELIAPYEEGRYTWKPDQSGPLVTIVVERIPRETQQRGRYMEVTSITIKGPDFQLVKQAYELLRARTLHPQPVWSDAHQGAA